MLSYRKALLLVALTILSVVRPPLFAEKHPYLQPDRERHSPSFRNTTAGGISGLALSDSFLQQIEDRIAIDSYQIRNHSVQPGPAPRPRPRYAAPRRIAEPLRIVHANLAPAIAAYRQTNESPLLPLRGFRAPILDHADSTSPSQLPVDDLTAGERSAAAIVQQRLARDGLLTTLTQILAALDPEQCLADLPATRRTLVRIGYPVDWLQHFQPEGVARPADRIETIIKTVAWHLIGNGAADSSVELLLPVTFDFKPSPVDNAWFDAPEAEPSASRKENGTDPQDLPGRFAIAAESGDEEIGTIRMQVGGGWRDGVVPGGSIDVIGQMADYFRSADFLISVAREMSPSFQSVITNSWRLRRRHQVTLCEELVEPSAWAQDNGKPGVIRSPSRPSARAATIVPRYACMDEGKSVFLPAESYLADGLRAAGHPVIHSPLLFQGGNMLCARHPGTSRRMLFLGEGTVYRNIALGLTRDQVLAAFAAEFDVDECIVLPVLSYHLDFDVTFRTRDNALLAFVNDTPAAARQIVSLGLSALATNGMIEPPAAERLRADLAENRIFPVVAALTNLIARQRTGTNALPASFASPFAGDVHDDAAGNLQVFLVALDVLESSLHDPKSSRGQSPRSAYLASLRRMEEARLRQIAALRQAGCRIVPVPSMQDLHRSINYLNGIQHRGGYVLPVFGGFYTALDQAAANVFRTALGPEAHLVPIRTAQCQRMHGAVHCTTSVYPRL